MLGKVCSYSVQGPVKVQIGEMVLNLTIELLSDVEATIIQGESLLAYDLMFSDVLPGDTFTANFD